MPNTGLDLALLIVTILLALLYSFSNGLNDAANAIATVVSTRVLRPIPAVVMGATLNFVGALTGTAVAKTIGTGIVRPEEVVLTTAMAAIAAAVIWVFLATRLSRPVSVSHALLASAVGAGLASGGVDAIVASGFYKVLVALALSPLVGFLVGFLFMGLLYRLLLRASPYFVSRWFSRLQLISAGWMAYAHGKNDGQNAAGIITFTLAIYYGWSAAEVEVPLWTLGASAAFIGLGTIIGGWRVINTLGMRVTKLEPVHGFAAETVAGSVIEAASRIGLPISTTHSITGAIMGVGATRRLSAVRWGVTREIVAAWLVSYPFCFVVAWVLAKLLGFVPSS